jgi:hypothetical protein
VAGLIGGSLFGSVRILRETCKHRRTGSERASERMIVHYCKLPSPTTSSFNGISSPIPHLIPPLTYPHRSPVLLTSHARRAITGCLHPRSQLPPTTSLSRSQSWVPQSRPLLLLNDSSLLVSLESALAPKIDHLSTRLLHILLPQRTRLDTHPLLPRLD